MKLTICTSDYKSQLGQMAVELCAVMPALLLVSIVVVDGLSFAALASKFDNLAAQATLSVAGAPKGTSFDAADAAGQIKTLLDEEMCSDQAQVQVAVEDAGNIATFECTMSVTPWPLSSGGATVLGMSVPSLLSHSYSFSVRPYVVGEL